jgi:hypothetical protein
MERGEHGGNAGIIQNKDRHSTKNKTLSRGEIIQKKG